MPISEQAFKLCGEPRQPEQLVFEGLPNPSWISRPLRAWIEKSWYSETPQLSLL